MILQDEQSITEQPHGRILDLIVVIQNEIEMMMSNKNEGRRKKKIRV